MTTTTDDDDDDTDVRWTSAPSSVTHSEMDHHRLPPKWALSLTQQELDTLRRIMEYKIESMLTVPSTAKRLEKKLFDVSYSRTEYEDESTLKTRLQNLREEMMMMMRPSPFPPLPAAPGQMDIPGSFSVMIKKEWMLSFPFVFDNIDTRIPQAFAAAQIIVLVQHICSEQPISVVTQVTEEATSNLIRVRWIIHDPYFDLYETCMNQVRLNVAALPTLTKDELTGVLLSESALDRLLEQRLTGTATPARKMNMFKMFYMRCSEFEQLSDEEKKKGVVEMWKERLEHVF